MAACQAALERVIPVDESKPLRGGRFIDWEDQAEGFIRAVAPVLLEERVALEDNAQVAQAGRCSFCSSPQVYLEKRVVKEELQTPHGAVVLEQQRCRCRSCGRTFSPSGPRLATAPGGVAVAAGGAADRAGGGAAAVRGGGAGGERGLGQ